MKSEKKTLEAFAFDLHIVVLFSVFKYNLKNYKNIVLVFSLLVAFSSVYIYKKKEKFILSSDNFLWNYTPVFFTFLIESITS